MDQSTPLRRRSSWFSSGARGAGKVSFLARAVLENGRDLVAQGWTQGAYARDRAGEPVHPWNAQARAWSVLGAIVCGDETHQGRVPIGMLAYAVMAVGDVLDTASLDGWNDMPGRTQADALAAFDAAIASVAERPESQVRRSSA